MRLKKPQQQEDVYKRQHPNSIAGNLCDGYIRIKVNGKLYRAHRLAFLYMTGSTPLDCTDHINGIKNDNRWCNLREATKQENRHNTGVQKNNTSGFKGVSWHKHAKKWRARARFNKKEIHIGYYNDANLASEAYNSFAKEHHKEFFRN